MKEYECPYCDNVKLERFENALDCPECGANFSESNKHLDPEKRITYEFWTDRGVNMVTSHFGNGLTQSFINPCK